MANKEFLQEIEDSEYWRDLSKFCFSDGKTIHSRSWINSAFDSLKDPFKAALDGTFYFVVRSNSRLLDIEHFFRLSFIKIAQSECIEISSEDIVFTGWKAARGMRAYMVEFNIYNHHYWEENLTRLVYYMLTLATIVDFPLSGEHMRNDSIADAVFEVYNHDNRIDPNKFFHRGMAKLFNVLINRRANPNKTRAMITDGPRIIIADMENLSLVLQSREDTNAALSRVKEFNSEKITDELLIQYETMRRHF